MSLLARLDRLPLSRPHYVLLVMGASMLVGPGKVASSLACSSCAYCAGEGLGGAPIRCQTV